VAHVCNPSYWNQEDQGSGTTKENSLQDSHLQKKQSRMDWRCGANGRVPVCKHEALSSNPSPTREKKKKKEKKKFLFLRQDHVNEGQSCKTELFSKLS
jgi:hypothetical protein